MAVDFLRLLQFSDGLFPAGGYAHSFGLETLVQSGRVQHAEEVAAFLRAYLESSAAPTDAVAVLCARKYALAQDFDACVRLDHLLDALKPAGELREASRQMGRQTFRVLRDITKVIPSTCHSERAQGITEVRPCSAPSDRSEEGISRRAVKGSALSGQHVAESETEQSQRPFEGRSLSCDTTSAPRSGACAPEEGFDALLTRFDAAVESGDALCHHPVVFGVAAAVNGWPPRETESAFLYSTSALIVGASLRLLPLGQLVGQRILAEAGTLIAALSETTLEPTEADMWSFTPELEIAAMRHESLDGRLFRS